MSDKNILGSHTISELTELEALARLLVGQLRPGDIVCLQGDLGAGKTTFAQYAGKALGVQEEITSPTYTILAEYEIPDNSQGIKRLIHIDAYRESMDTNYVHEILQTAKDEKVAVLIEWPEKLGSEILQPHWTISISNTDNNGRIVVVSRVE